MARCLLGVLGLFLVGTALSAGERSPWLGKAVLLKPDAVATNNGETVPRRLLGPISRVHHVDGERLWLGRAWVAAADVIPLEQLKAETDERLEKNPADAEAWYRRGCLQLESDERARLTQHVEAIESLSEAIRLDNQMVAAYRARAQAKWDSDLNGAIDDMNEAIRLDPSCAKSRVLRGDLHWRANDFGKAEEDFEATICLDRNESRGWHGLAIVAMKKGEPEIALEHIAEAIRLNPYSADFYNNHGVCRVAMEDASRAVEEFTAAIRLEPWEPDRYATRAKGWRLLDNEAMALVDLKRALELDPKNEAALSIRGTIHFDESRFEDAINDLEKCVEHHPKCADAHVRLALIRMDCEDERFRDAKLAVKHAEKAALHSKPLTATTVAVLAAAYAEAADWDRAVDMIEEAIRMNDNEEAAQWYHAARAQYLDKKPMPRGNWLK